MLDVSSTAKFKYAKKTFQGPYKVLQVNDNSTLVLEIDPIINTVNIRNVKPYKQVTNPTKNN